MNKKPHGNIGNQNAAKADPKDARLSIRLTTAVKEKALRDAHRRSMSVADWIQAVILAQD